MKLERGSVVQLLLAMLVVVIAALNGAPATPVHAANPGVTVTSKEDAGGNAGAVCPDDTLCTLRRAIEVANLDPTPGEFTIQFAVDAFPSGDPATILVGSTALPTISRADVTIDGTGAGVVIEGTSVSLSTAMNGITATGTGFSLRGVQIRGFSASCVAVTGARATIGAAGAGITVGGCASGIAVSGNASKVAGNIIGFTASGAVDAVQTGIVVSAGSVVVGGPVAADGNIVGFADAGIFVGAGAGGAFTGVDIERNTIGRRPNGDVAVVGVGIVLAQPSSVTQVVANAIHNAATAIQVRADSGGVSVIRNRFAANTFQGITGMAIDLGADDVRNPNDDGGGDSGPNMLVNHPLITHATQTLVSGNACANCNVEIYLAHHEPGGNRDYGQAPLPAGTAVATASGEFQVTNPAASAGDWLVALATDGDGNTSEFGPPARVGSGAILCGNVELQSGWNHVGYFGNSTVALLNDFAADPGGAVTAIFRTVDGTNEWQRWFKGTASDRTLTTVEPGESYWIYAASPVTLAGGFSVSFPVPVQLQRGPNDFTYLGATANVLDALASLNGGFTDLYGYDVATGHWQRFGDPSVPSWAQDFTTLEACGTYQLRVDAPATLIPLQP